MFKKGAKLLEVPKFKGNYKSIVGWEGKSPEYIYDFV